MNDFDPDGSGFIMNSTQPTNGQLRSAVTNGSFTYVPNPGFTGTDSFTYFVRDDDNNLSAAGTVTITVYPDANRPPVAIADYYLTPPDVTLTVAAPGAIRNDMDPDGDTFIMSSVTQPSNGQLTSAVTNGAFTYVPNPGFHGTDSFTYAIRDEHDELSTAGTVTIYVLPPPDMTPPTITVSSPIVLFPPNNQFRGLTVNELVSAVSDNIDTSLSPDNVVITRVTSDEPAGSGRAGADIAIAPQCKSVNLRAERAGNGNGRVYTIELAIADGERQRRDSGRRSSRTHGCGQASREGRFGSGGAGLRALAHGDDVTRRVADAVQGAAAGTAPPPVPDARSRCRVRVRFRGDSRGTGIDDVAGLYWQP